MPDDQTAKKPTIGERLTQTLDDPADAATDTTGSASAERAAAAAADSKGKSLEELIADLPPERQEAYRRSHRTLQVNHDRAQAELTKAKARLEGITDEDLVTARLIKTNPDLADQVVRLGQDYQAGRLTKAEAKAEITEAIQDDLKAILDDKRLDGESRAVLTQYSKALTKAAVQEVDGLFKGLDRRMQVVESLLVQSHTEKESSALDTLKAEMGEELFDRYRVEATKLIRAGVKPRSAFLAAMDGSDEDILMWRRPKQQATVQRKKAVAELTPRTSGAPSDAESAPRGTKKKWWSSLLAEEMGKRGWT